MRRTQIQQAVDRLSDAEAAGVAARERGAIVGRLEAAFAEPTARAALERELVAGGGWFSAAGRRVLLRALGGRHVPAEA